MTKLLRKNTPFVWSEECEASFQTLKKKLTTAVTSQDFIKFLGEIFAFVLLVLIEISQGFKTF
jgi:hypothetical protein